MITEGEAAIPLEMTWRAFGNQEKSKQRSAIIYGISQKIAKLINFCSLRLAIKNNFYNFLLLQNSACDYISNYTVSKKSFPAFIRML